MIHQLGQKQLETFGSSEATAAAYIALNIENPTTQTPILLHILSPSSSNPSVHITAALKAVFYNMKRASILAAGALLGLAEAGVHKMKLQKVPLSSQLVCWLRRVKSISTRSTDMVR